MFYIDKYESPLGAITLAGDGESLTGLWFDGQKYDRAGLAEGGADQAETPVFAEARRWLDIYFSGHEPGFTPRLRFTGTEFRALVGRIMLEIPYGTVMTYGDLAREAARRLGRSRMSAQAVGGAVGHNPISVIVPCHRVVGTDGSLTGYAGGIARKLSLLRLEGVEPDSAGLYVPERGTAL